VAAPWPTSTPLTGGADVSAAALSGLVATLDIANQSIELRDVLGNLRRSISTGEVTSAATAIPAARALISGVTLSDSGRLLFVAVQDSAGIGTDTIVRLDIDTGAWSTVCSFELSPTGLLSRVPMAHMGGKLYIGAEGRVEVWRAERSGTVLGKLGQWNTSSTGPIDRVTGLALDRLSGDLYITKANRLLRTSVSASFSQLPTNVATLSANPVALAWSDHFGAEGQAGLYVLNATGSIAFITPAAARGTAGFSSITYTTIAAPRSLTTTCDGALIGAGATALTTIRDDADTRLSLSVFALDEFRQHVRFAKGLISPDGEPAGWVIDADVWPQWNRFHPASPDGAAWVVLMLLASEEVDNDPQALPLARTVLQRYAGLAPDNIRPLRSADGIYWHWIEPLTGGAKSGWGDSYATLSTMKMVLAAARARQRWASDPSIRASASSIICSVRNWDSYLFGSTQYYLLGNAAGGPTTTSRSAAFNEGIQFIEQAARYGGPSSRTAYQTWINPQNLPAALYLAGRPVTGYDFTGFQPAFVTIYSLLLQRDFRNSAAWQTHTKNLLASQAAWTDDNTPRWFTVFSAGTTASQWGGYHADALNDSPGNIAHFPALLGLGARQPGGSIPELAAAYHAYRTGARETFKSGASLLYRRSSVDPSYTPDSAGLPDVTIGGLALAEYIKPGTINKVLLGLYPSCSSCPADVARLGGSLGQDNQLTSDDLIAFLGSFFTGDTITADIASLGGTSAPDGQLTVDDLVAFLGSFFAGCQ
jgi:hypothetical protein